MAAQAGKQAGPRESSSSWFIRSKGPAAKNGWIELTYVGPKALSLTGAATGARYHFGWRGATLPVDRRDAQDLLSRDDLRVYKQ